MCLVIRPKKKSNSYCLLQANSLEDSLATPRKADYKPQMSQESCCQGISPKELLYENVHTLWPSLLDRSGILFKPSPSTYAGDLWKVDSSQYLIFLLQGLWIII